MFDARKILIIFVIGILYAIFSYSLVDAVYPAPEYEDYCREIMKPMPLRAPGLEPQNCPVVAEPSCDPRAAYSYDYDERGCVKKITCNNCNIDLEAAREKYNLIFFIFSTILGIAAIGIGLFLPKKKHPLNEWVATGFMLGGLITLFIGTAIYYADMARIARPIVILAELILVVYLAYKNLKK